MCNIQGRIVRYGDLQPCKTAFIDAHTPGSDQKENFTIIGGGVSESPDQYVHLTDQIGFNIGAAGQPPKCRNSLHSHTTAEVFFVLKGRWRFFWGRTGTDGEFITDEDGVGAMPLLSEDELKAFPKVPVERVIRNYVARYWDLMALAANKPAKVIGEAALLRDKPGFDIDFLTRGSIPDEMHSHDKPTVLMPMRGHWKLRLEGGETVLNPGDTCLINANEAHAIAPSMTGEASLYRVTKTDDPAGLTWVDN
ncbi:MAG: cupin [Rhodobacteraceae bacterium]|nr:cupin [Paracoccaceae bacterium]